MMGVGAFALTLQHKFIQGLDCGVKLRDFAAQIPRMYPKARKLLF